ncbi:MAG: hypothetical protein M1514_03920 [Patescibacteria group bacterium]|nr:hypothetical protein [Patescibacteria group bacterium]
MTEGNIGKLTRRELLKLGAAATGSTLAATVGIANKNSGQEIAATTTPKREKLTKKKVNGVIFTFQNGRPIAAEGETSVKFDHREVILAQKEALDQKELQIIGLVKGKTLPAKVEDTLLNPPNLTPEKLIKGGVEIVSGLGVKDRLFFLEEAEPLKDFSQEGRHLRIILIGGHRLTPYTLATSQIPGLEKFIQAQFGNFTPFDQKKKYFQPDLEARKTIYALRASGGLSTQEFANRLIDAKARAMIEETMTDYEIATTIPFDKGAAGYFVNPDLNEKWFGRPNEATIFVAAGETFSFQGAALVATPQGRFLIQEVSWGITQSSRPKPRSVQSFDSPGFILGHEFAEYFLWQTNKTEQKDKEQIADEMAKKFSPFIVWQTPEGYILN